VRKPGIDKTKRNQKGRSEPSKAKNQQARVKQWLTIDLLPLRLEVAARGLDRQLEALDGFALLAEGQLLAGVANAERERLVLDLGERGVPLLQ
jgi:hypothetical protein